MTRAKSTEVLRHPPKPTDGLLRRLTGYPNLPGYLERLPAPSLNRLIEAVGLEDSQELLALLGRDQMKAVLSVSLWQSPRPGQEQVLDLDQLIRWIDIWMQEGEETLTRRVLDLGEDFLVASLAKLLTAVDRTTEGIEETGLEIAQYVIFPKQERHWPRIVAMLSTLWRHEPDVLLRVLGRCSFHRSVLKDDTTEDDGGEALYQDVAGERQSERAGAGYVNPVHASMFLMKAKTTDLQALRAAREYDLDTAAYLRKPLERIEHSSSAAEQAWSNAVADDEPQQRAARNSSALTNPVAQSEDFADLDAVLRDAGIFEDLQAPLALLTDQRASRPRSQWLEAALGLLTEEAPGMASRRMGELAFLSNVLMSGGQAQGRAFRESEAVKVAVATANLGLTHLLEESSSVDQARRWLEEDPGVVRLFQIGYHLLSAIPRQCCEAVYRAKAVQAKRPGHVVIMEMEAVLGASRLTDLVNDGLYGEAKSLIDGLSAVMDSAACVALRILVDPTPCFPRVLDSDSPAAHTYVDKGYRPIATADDLERITAFLHDLPAHCGS